MPTLAASYLVLSAASNQTALTTPSFTPATGEIIVVKYATEDAGKPFSGAPAGTAGGITWTKRAENTTASTTYGAIWTGTVTAGGTAMTISSSALGISAWHSMIVERWTNAQLAATPATNVTRGTGAPSGSLTTVANGSVVSWTNGDWAAISPTSRTYRSGATEEGIHDKSTTIYVAYFATQAAATAGAQTYGLTAPTGQTYTLLAIEIQDAGGGSNAATLSASVPRLTASITGTQTNPAAATATVPRLTATITGTQTNPGALAAQVPVLTAALTGSQTNAAVLNATVPVLTSAIAGTATNPATLNASVPRLTSSIADTPVTNAATMNAALPRLTSNLTGAQTNPAVLNVSVPRLTSSIAVAASVNAATLNTSTPRLTSSITGTMTNPAVLNATLPTLTATLFTVVHVVNDEVRRNITVAGASRSRWAGASSASSDRAGTSGTRWAGGSSQPHDISDTSHPRWEGTSHA